MRIVKLNENYLKEILKINNHINKEGIGLAVNLRDNYIFIPMTSQIKYEIEKLNYLDYPLFNIGNKRTGFAIMNKILIQNGIGLVLITEELEKKFSEKLFLCYKEKGEKSKREFIEFIKNYCYIKF